VEALKWMSILAVCATLGILSAVGCGSDNLMDAAEDGNVTQFSYAVSDCAGLTRPAAGKPATFTDDAIKVSGNTISFDHILETYCNAKTDGALQVTQVIDGQTIVVNEVFKGDAVYCVCPFPISGKIEGLAPGAYNLSFVYGVELVTSGYTQEPVVLYETTVTVSD